MRLGFLGCGTIASAVVRGLAGKGHQITVSERSKAHSAMLAKAFGDVTAAGNQAVIDASDVIFLGLLAETAEGILKELAFREDQRVISFMLCSQGLRKSTTLGCLVVMGACGC